MFEEEINQDLENEVVDDEVSPELKKAMEMGYNPDYDGDNKVTPEEFVSRKPLYDTQRKLKRRIRDLEQTVVRTKQVSEKLLESQQAELLSKLEAQKAKAVEDGDTAKVLEVHSKIEEQKNKPVEQTQQSVNPEYQAFLDRNSWYEDDSDMQGWADGTALRYKQSKPNASDSDVIAHIEKRVKEVFSHKFESRSKKPSVESPSRGPSRPRDADELGWTDIPKMYRTAAIETWKSGAFKDKEGNPVSKKEAMKRYAQDLKKIGEIE